MSMTKPVRVYDDYKVVAVVSLYHKVGNEYHAVNYRECERLKKEIERHCDGWDDVYIEVEAHLECPYCHLEWELEEDGSPACCTKAWEEWAKESGVSIC